MGSVVPAASAMLLLVAARGVDCSTAYQHSEQAGTGGLSNSENNGNGGLSLGTAGEVTWTGNGTGVLDCEMCTKLSHIWCKSTTATLNFTDGLCIVDQPVECGWDKAVKKPWMCPVGTSGSYWGVFNFVVLTLAAWLVGIAFQACQLPIITGGCAWFAVGLPRVRFGAHRACVWNTAV